MLAKFFKRSEPISFVSLMILLGVWVFSYNFKITEEHSFFLKTINVLGVYLFFLIILVLQNFIIQRYRLTGSHYYALFVFVILVGLYPSVIEINKVSVSYLFILLSARRVFSLRNKDYSLQKLFDSGFLLGIAYLIYPVSFFYLFFIYIGYFVYIKIVDKYLLIPLIGFAIPVFLTFTYLYFFDKYNIFKTMTEINLIIGIDWFYNWRFSVPLIILASILAFLILKLLSVSVFAELEQERNYKLLIAHLLISIFIIFLTSQNIHHSILLVFFSGMVLIGNSINTIRRKWVKELFLYSLLAASLYVYFL